VVSKGGPAGTAINVASGVSNGSRIGFRGTEALGGGPTALFTLESGILLDTGASDQSGVLFGRQALVGLEGRLGTITLGRQYTPIYQTLTAVDPFGNNRTNYGGAGGQLMSGEKAGTRMNNAVLYASPKLDGLSSVLAFGFGEVPGDTAKSRQFGYSATYEGGPIFVRGAFNRTTNAAATDSARNALLIAKYNFGSVIAALGYGDNKGAGNVDSQDYIAALTVPIQQSTVMATFIRKKDRATTNLSANQVALAYTYSLSKRTVLYAAAAILAIGAIGATIAQRLPERRLMRYSVQPWATAQSVVDCSVSRPSCISHAQKLSITGLDFD
jgi:GBP family porin